jgi:hypothetical protein
VHGVGLADPVAARGAVPPDDPIHVNNVAQKLVTVGRGQRSGRRPAKRDGGGLYPAAVGPVFTGAQVVPRWRPGLALSACQPDKAKPAAASQEPQACAQSTSGSSRLRWL